MKNKFKWVVSFCLMLFISLNCLCIKVFASDYVMGSYPSPTWGYASVASYSKFDTKLWENVAFAYSNNSDGMSRYINVYYSHSPIKLTDVSNQLTVSSLCFSMPCGYRDDDKRINVYSSGALSLPITALYMIKGTGTHNGINIETGTSEQTGIAPTLSKNDILNFNWQGNGLKIYNLEKNMKVSGYMNKETGLKWFDIECYGQFTNSSSSWFSSFAKKSMQTKLQNNCYVTVGGETRHVGEGVGIKSFDWVSSDSTNVGSLMKFRVVLTVPMLVSGSNNVIAGTTIPDGSQYIKDTIENVNFLSNNEDTYGQPPVDGGSTSYVDGKSSGNNETYKNSDSSISGFISIFTSIGNGIVDFFKTILNVLTSIGSIAPQIATAFSALFMFLPSPIPELITTAFALIIFVTILHFIRG